MAADDFVCKKNGHIFTFWYQYLFLSYIFHVDKQFDWKHKKNRPQNIIFGDIENSRSEYILGHHMT